MAMKMKTGKRKMMTMMTRYHDDDDDIRIMQQGEAQQTVQRKDDDGKNVNFSSRHPFWIVVGSWLYGTSNQWMTTMTALDSSSSSHLLLSSSVSSSSSLRVPGLSQQQDFDVPPGLTPAAYDDERGSHDTDLVNRKGRKSKRRSSEAAAAAAATAKTLSPETIKHKQRTTRRTKRGNLRGAVTPPSATNRDSGGTYPDNDNDNGYDSPQGQEQEQRHQSQDQEKVQNVNEMVLLPQLFSWELENMFQNVPWDQEQVQQQRQQDEYCHWQLGPIHGSWHVDCSVPTPCDDGHVDANDYVNVNNENNDDVAWLFNTSQCSIWTMSFFYDGHETLNSNVCIDFATKENKKTVLDDDKHHHATTTNTATTASSPDHQMCLSLNIPMVKPTTTTTKKEQHNDENVNHHHHQYDIDQKVAETTSTVAATCRATHGGQTCSSCRVLSPTTEAESEKESSPCVLVNCSNIHQPSMIREEEQHEEHDDDDSCHSIESLFPREADVPPFLRVFLGGSRMEAKMITTAPQEKEEEEEVTASKESRKENPQTKADTVTKKNQMTDRPFVPSSTTPANRTSTTKTHRRRLRSRSQRTVNNVDTPHGGSYNTKNENKDQNDDVDNDYDFDLNVMSSNGLISLLNIARHYVLHTRN